MIKNASFLQQDLHLWAELVDSRQLKCSENSIKQTASLASPLVIHLNVQSKSYFSFPSLCADKEAQFEFE